MLGHIPHFSSGVLLWSFIECGHSHLEAIEIFAMMLLLDVSVSFVGKAKVTGRKLFGDSIVLCRHLNRGILLLNWTGSFSNKHNRLQFNPFRDSKERLFLLTVDKITTFLVLSLTNIDIVLDSIHYSNMTLSIILIILCFFS